MAQRVVATYVSARWNVKMRDYKSRVGMLKCGIIRAIQDGTQPFVIHHLEADKCSNLASKHYLW